MSAWHLVSAQEVSAVILKNQASFKRIDPFHSTTVFIIFLSKYHQFKIFSKFPFMGKLNTELNLKKKNHLPLPYTRTFSALHFLQENSSLPCLASSVLWDLVQSAFALCPAALWMLIPATPITGTCLAHALASNHLPHLSHPTSQILNSSSSHMSLLQPGWEKQAFLPYVDLGVPGHEILGPGNRIYL